MKFNFSLPPGLKKRGQAFVCFCRASPRLVALLTVAAVLITALQCIGMHTMAGRYVADGHGTISAIYKPTGDGQVSLPLRIIGERENLKTEMQVVLSFDDRDSAEDAGDGEVSRDPLEALRSALKEAAADVEESQESLIPLPAVLEDGTKVTWKQEKKGLSLFAGFLLIPAGLWFCYRDQMQKAAGKKKKREDCIRRNLPGFTNQLLLLLNSGLILQDAFQRIAASGGKAGEKLNGEAEEDPFRQLLLDINKEAIQSSKSLISVLEDVSARLGIREFSRLTGILADHQYRGVDLGEKLASESDLLWNQRKKLAEERGKTAETKLAFPLAILLLVLILVTAAPAILQI